jgi:hypothetical protein
VRVVVVIWWTTAWRIRWRVPRVSNQSATVRLSNAWDEAEWRCFHAKRRAALHLDRRLNCAQAEKARAPRNCASRRVRRAMRRVIRPPRGEDVPKVFGGP